MQNHEFSTRSRKAEYALRLLWVRLLWEKNSIELRSNKADSYYESTS